MNQAKRTEASSVDGPFEFQLWYPPADGGSVADLIDNPPPTSPGLLQFLIGSGRWETLAAVTSADWLPPKDAELHVRARSKVQVDDLEALFALPVRAFSAVGALAEVERDFVLENFVDLHRVNVMGATPSGDKEIRVGKLREMRHLLLGQVPKAVTGVEALANLEVLWMSGCDVSQQSTASWRDSLSKLTCLLLQSCRLGAGSLRQLPTSLRDISLAVSEVADQDAADIIACQELRALRITGISSACLAEIIKGLPNLRILAFYDTELTSQIAQAVLEHPTLHTLSGNFDRSALGAIPNDRILAVNGVLHHN